jgi:hypothetical protein
MQHLPRSFTIALAYALLTRCSSPSSTDAGRDASAADAEAADAHAGGVDAASNADATPLPDATMLLDAMPASDAMSGADAASMDSALPDAHVVPDAGCVPPLANCNGTGMTCEVNTATNAMNCGECGRSCFGAQCSSSLCNGTPIAPAEALQWAEIQGIAYFFSSNALPATFYDLRRASNEGTTAEVISMGNGAPGGIDVDASYVYFAVSVQGMTPTVYRKAHTAAAAAAPEVVFNAVTFPQFMALRGGVFYWLSAEPNQHVFKRALAAPMSDQGTQLTTASESHVDQFTATSTTLYWVRGVGNTYTLRRFALTATAALDVLGAPVSPGVSIHADATRVFWGMYGGSPAPGLYSYYSGGTPTLLFPNNAVRIAFPDPLSDQVYFADWVSPVYRMPKTGGAPVEVAATFFGYDFIGTDAHFIFAGAQWGTSSTGYRYVK